MQALCKAGKGLLHRHDLPDAIFIKAALEQSLAQRLHLLSADQDHFIRAAGRMRAQTAVELFLLFAQIDHPSRASAPAHRRLPRRLQD